MSMEEAILLDSNINLERERNELRYENVKLKELLRQAIVIMNVTTIIEDDRDEFFKLPEIKEIRWKH